MTLTQTATGPLFFFFVVGCERGGGERGEGERQGVGFGKLPAGRKAAAPGAQSQDRRGDPDQRPPRRHFPRQPETESHGRELAPWSQAAGKLIYRRSLPSAT